ncbi:MAG: histidinol-phosphate transaminase [Sarcina sp.]
MSFKVRDEINDVAKYVAGKPISEVKRELGLSRVVKMASNENPLGCSDKVKEALKRAIDETFLYPDASNHELIEVLAKHLKVSKDEIFLGGGSSSLIKVICNTVLSKDDESIMADLTFPLYENYTKLMGAKAVKVPLKNMKLDLNAMVNAITDKTKIIWLCNPNNPTGTVFTKEEVKRVLGKIPNNVLIVMDEAYIEYVTDNAFPDSLEIRKNRKNFLILRTFSKAYGLASLRVGYGIADKELVSYFNRVINPFEVNLYAQKAAVTSLKDTEYLCRVIMYNHVERERIYKGLDEVGIEYVKSQANFILFKSIGEDKLLADFLLKKGFIVRPGYLLGCEGYIRVSIGTEEDNKEFLELLKEYKEKVNNLYKEQVSTENI